MISGKRFCKRCLLREVDEAYFQSIYKYIDSLPPEQKAEQEEYKRRLEKCKACDHLQNGMCALCGCFVEVRAVKKKQHCALSPDIW